MPECRKPRLLCLHGGGVSARIFKLQMRQFLRSLAPYFRLVFADGPWLSEMHEDLKPVYSGMGPCRRWARWLPHHAPLEHGLAVRQIERSLTDAMDKDDGKGDWVGLVGFSQGAKLAFSILLENQLRTDKWHPGHFAGVHWRFGVIMAGRAAPFDLSDDGSASEENPNAFSTLTGLAPPFAPHHTHGFSGIQRLQVPTLHVHGLQDGGLALHRDLHEYFASPTQSRVIEWNGGHRIPLKTADVARVTEAILAVAKTAQALDLSLTEQVVQVPIGVTEGHRSILHCIEPRDHQPASRNVGPRLFALAGV